MTGGSFPPFTQVYMTPIYQSTNYTKRKHYGTDNKNRARKSKQFLGVKISHDALPLKEYMRLEDI